MNFEIYRIYEPDSSIRQLIASDTYIYTLDNDYVQFDCRNLIAGNVLNNRIRWDFGDGTRAEGASPIKTYKFPGLYTIKLSLFDSFFNEIKFEKTLRVTNYIKDSLSVVSNSPVFGNTTGESNIISIKESEISGDITVNRYNSWQSLSNYDNGESYSYVLYPSYSKSYYYTKENYDKNSQAHLIPIVKFYSKVIDTNGSISYEQIDKITTDNTLIYIKKYEDFTFKQFDNVTAIDSYAGIVTVGGSFGKATFNISDDTKTDNSDINNADIRQIYVTLQNNKIPNSTDYNINYDKSEFVFPDALETSNISAEIDYEVYSNEINKIWITSNGITNKGDYITDFDINPIQWKDVTIPFTVTFGNEYNTILRKENEIILVDSFDLSSGENLSSMLSSSKIIIKLLSSDDHINWTPVENSIILKSDEYKDLENITKGYFHGILSTSESIFKDLDFNMCMLSAHAWVKIEKEIVYPKYLFATSQEFDTLYRFKRQYVKNRPDLSLFGDVYIQNNSLKSITGNYGIAYDAVNERVWYTNPFDNKVELIDSVTGDLINSYDIPIISSNPCAITVNGDGNAWVSLPDSMSINAYLLNANGGIIQSVQETLLSSANLSSAVNYTVPGYLGQVGENILQATDLDEYNGSLYILYSHYLQNWIVKVSSGSSLYSSASKNTNYNQYGDDDWVYEDFNYIIDEEDDNIYFFNYISSIDKGIIYTAIKLNNNGTYLVSAGSDLDTKRNTLFLMNGDLLTEHEFYIDEPIGCLHFDRYNRLWVSHGTSKVSIFEIDTDIKILKHLHTLQLTTSESYEHHISGITSDKTHAWVIDNNKRRLYAIELDLTTLNPTSTITDPEFVTIDMAPYATFPSGINEIIAYGDWSGFSNIQKYHPNLLSSNEQLFDFTAEDIIQINGTSALFNIYERDYFGNMQKINEDFDFTNSLKNSTKQQNILECDNLFNEFFGNIYGNDESSPNHYGKKIYEKISNFVMNNADIDFCNIKSVYSFADQFGIEISEKDISYPYNLTRVIDMLSVKFTNLVPLYNRFDDEFGNKYSKGKNIGNKLDFDSYIIQKGNPIVVFEKFSEIFTKQSTDINIGALSSQNQFPLSSWNTNWGWSLVLPDNLSSGSAITNYYDFYEYVPGENGKILNYFIDYNYTDVNMLSSYDTWNRKNGTVEAIIQQDIIDGLKLN